MFVVFIAALAPLLWGSNFFITTEFLPNDAALWIGFWRSFPVGLIWVLFLRHKPSRDWWPKLIVLSAANVGLFFPLLFFAAYLVPGGLGTMLIASNPLVVALLAWWILGQRPNLTLSLLLMLGLIGVLLLVGGSTVALDPIGIGVSLLAVASFAVGTVLSERWGIMDDNLGAFTAWQLLLGALMIAPLAFIIEGPSPSFFPTQEQDSWAACIGIVWIAVVNTGFAYWAWFWGLQRLRSFAVSMLTLLSPVLAYALDLWFELADLGFWEMAGIFLVVLSLALHAFHQQRAVDDLESEHC